MGRPKASDVAASAAQRIHHLASTQPHTEDQEQVVPAGRSWVYSYCQPAKTTTTWCAKKLTTAAAPGTRGSTDNRSGTIKLKSAALNPLARHLKAALTLGLVSCLFCKGFAMALQVVWWCFQ